MQSELGLVNRTRAASMGSIGETLSMKPWIETPLIESKNLSRVAGCRILLKLENLQPSASFKSRGIGNLILSQIAHQQSLGSTKPLHFYISSGGNAGLAAVTAAIPLGYKASVCVPTTTDATMVAKLKVAGATEVITHGDSWFYADTHLRTVLMPAAAQQGEEPVYLPPFDHPDVWYGNGTMIEEISSQMPDNEKPDAVICSVGGGGLFSGIMNGLDRVGWSDVSVLAMETKGADSLAESIRQGRLATLPGITSIATSLGAVTVAPKAYEEAQRKNVQSHVLEDAEAAMGCWRFADDERILVEPACGVSVAMCYDGRLKRVIPNLSPESKIVVVVCGGSRISLDLLAEYRRKYAARAEELGLKWRSQTQEQNGGEEGLATKLNKTGDEDVPSSHMQPVAPT